MDIAFEKLANQGLLITRDYKNLVAYREAKEMEMQQNANTWNNAINAVEKDKWESFEQYYNETYNGNHIVEANKMMGEGK